MDAARVRANLLELAERLEFPKRYDDQRENARAKLITESGANFERVARISLGLLANHDKAIGFSFRLADAICESEKLEYNWYERFDLGGYILHQMVLMGLCRLEWSDNERYKCLVILLSDNSALGRTEPSTSEFPFPYWDGKRDKFGNELATHNAFVPDWNFTGEPPALDEERIWHPFIERNFLNPEDARRNIKEIMERSWLTRLPLRKPIYQRSRLNPVPWIQAINNIESNEYRINRKQLELIHALDEKYVLVPNPKRTKNPPQKGSLGAKRRARRLLFEAIIKRADDLAKLDGFYQRCFVDYRGRTYLSRSLLNYQGDDVARSLIEFRQGIELNRDGLDALLLHAANLYGCKESPTDRVKFARQRLKRWRDYAANPVKTYDKWRVDENGEELDDPLLFIRACMELRNATTDGRHTLKKGFVTHLPVEVDQSNSVIQHLAAMRRRDWDGATARNLARKANLIEAGDFYTWLANDIRISDSLTDGQRRKLIKKMVVPRSYGSGAGEIAKQWGELGIKAISRLSKEQREAKAQDAIEELERKVPELKEFRRDIGQIYTELQRRCPPTGKFYTQSGNPIPPAPPFVFSLPNGFTVRLHEKYAGKVKRVRVAYSKAQHDESGWYGYAKLKAYHPDKDGDGNPLLGDPKETRKALQTAVIHSLDAVVAHSVVNNAEFPVIAVHDAWACHANNIPRLRKIFRDQFSLLHQAELPYFVIRRDVLGDALPSGGFLDLDTADEQDLLEFSFEIQGFPDSIS